MAATSGSHPVGSREEPGLPSEGWLAVTRRVFSIDLRSLALFRIALALLLLADLAARSFDMRDFYTDHGVLPRSWWLMLSSPWQFSLHAANGELGWQVLLFSIAAVFALGLMVGYRSRLMTLGSFVLLASLLNRNGLILQGGDNLLIVMCFWAVFLPLGARFSIDAALQPALRDNANPVRGDEFGSYFSVATIAIILQVLSLYFFTALLKTGDAWRVNFDAAYYAVSLQHFATPIGTWVSQFPKLLKVATVFVLIVEFVAPVLVLLPFLWPRLRLLGWALMMSLHVAFLLMLHIGLFPFIDFMALSLLIPSAVWIWLAARRRDPAVEGITIYYDRDCGFCLKMCLILREFLLPRSVQILRAQDTPEIGEILERENSWVVRDADGGIHLHWRAMQFLFSRRWPFKPIGWLMTVPPLMAVGHKVYRWIAENRGAFGDFTGRALPFRPLPLRPRWLGAIVAASFFYIVLFFNVAGLPGYQNLAWRHVDRIAQLVRIDQRWDMFAPFPLTYSVYPTIVGTLRSGDVVDVYPLASHSSDWQAPEDFYSLFPSYRWRKYLERIEGTSNKKVLESYGNYLCNSWNKPGLASQQQLGTLDVNFVMRLTNTTGAPKEERRKMVWRHWCYPEFAPKEP